MGDSDADIRRAREFFPRGLFQPEGSFRFSLDALLLAAYAARRRPEWRRLADLGCGAGAVAFGLLLLAGEGTGRRVLGLELRPELVEAARRNAAGLGFAGAFRAEPADLTAYAPGRAAGGFDLITANPPYRRPEEGRLPPDELRRAALFGGPENLAAFIRAGRTLIAPGGQFCLIFPYRRLDELAKSLRGAGLALLDAMPVAARAGAEPKLALVSAGIAAEENKGLAGGAQKPLVLYEPTAGGGERLGRAALEFCRFLSCNTKG